MNPSKKPHQASAVQNKYSTYFPSSIINKKDTVRKHQLIFIYFIKNNIATMKFSSFAVAALVIATSSVNAFSAPKFAVHQVCV
mmetsp:Transcript_28243/g.28607  ORF Transcript_28243/g.28607 Transcript_28243/m.28607 type:complete len:83 (-) Transcript_28243:2612-2860(-)